MSDSSQTEQDTLEAIRNGNGQAWGQFIDEYQGRLLRFARTRVAQHADAEDVVQETFASFVKALDRIQVTVSLETYLFGILRHEIVNRFRSQTTRTVCLIQDIYGAESSDAPINALDRQAACDPSVSGCVCHDEQQALQERTLAQALTRLVANFKRSENLRDLKIAELLFYCKLRNKDAAQLLSLNPGLVRVVKHRCLKQIRAHVLQRRQAGDMTFSCSENVLTRIWESHRLSCPKRSTLGAFLLENLPVEWFDYVDFHLATVGCHFCRASFKDLQERQDSQQQESFRQRVLNSTVGFFSKP